MNARRLLARAPRAGLVVLAGVGAALPARPGKDDAAAFALVPSLGPAARRRSARARRSGTLRYGLLHYVTLERPGVRYGRWVHGPAAEVPQAPAVLMSFHVGPVLAFATYLERLGGGVLALQQRGGVGWDRGLSAQERPSIDTRDVGTTEPARTATMFAAAKALRTGRCVFLLGEAPDAANAVTATVLGHPFCLGRGAFALARLTGVPVVPVAAGWRRVRAGIRVGPPVPAGPDEEMAAAVAAWLDGLLREDPSLIEDGWARWTRLLP